MSKNLCIFVNSVVKEGLFKVYFENLKFIVMYIYMWKVGEIVYVLLKLLYWQNQVVLLYQLYLRILFLCFSEFDLIEDNLFFFYVFQVYFLSVLML